MSVRVSCLIAAAVLVSGLSQAAAADTSCAPRVRGDTESAVLVRGLDGAYFDVARDLTETYELNDETAADLSEFAAALDALGTKLIVVPVPPRALMLREKLDPEDPQQQAFDAAEAGASYDRLLAQLQAAGMVVADLRKGAKDAAAAEKLMFRRDTQWTPEGARDAAQEVARIVRSGPLYSGFLQRIYRTETLGVFDHRSDMAQLVQRSCAVPLPAEKVTRYRTRTDTMETSIKPAAAGRPILVVAGSANSANPNNNFDGFLSEFTNLAIVNRSNKEASPYSALISVVSAPDFLVSPPRYLVWEFPAEANLNYLSSVQLRQVLAGTATCAASDAIWKGTIESARGRREFAIDQAPAPDQPGVIVFDVKSDRVKTLNVKVRYDDGEVETLRLGGPNEHGATSRYATRLSSEIRGTVTSVELIGLSEDAAPVSARICPSITKKGS